MKTSIKDKLTFMGRWVFNFIHNLYIKAKNILRHHMHVKWI